MISQPPVVPVATRWLIRRDMPQVLHIEQTSCRTPWCEKDFVTALRQRHCIGVVAERDHRVLGFMIYEISKARFNILNIAVHPAYLRREIGTQLVNVLINRLTVTRRRAIRVEVRERNLPAQLFFRANRFLATEVLWNEYMDTGEDCYVMQYELHPENEVPS